MVHGVRMDYRLQVMRFAVDYEICSWWRSDGFRCRVWAVDMGGKVLAVLRGGQLAEEKGKMGSADQQIEMNCVKSWLARGVHC